jgi:hypothetical protein
VEGCDRLAGTGAQLKSHLYGCSAHVSLEQASPVSEEPRVDLLALDEALNAWSRSRSQ